jgi:hypothetical protein
MPLSQHHSDAQFVDVVFVRITGLKSHMTEHATPRQCRLCGKQLRESEYHRC